MHTIGRLGRKVCATPESVHVPCANQACAQRVPGDARSSQSLTRVRAHSACVLRVCGSVGGRQKAYHTTFQCYCR